MFKPLKLGFANQNNQRTAVTHPSYSISKATRPSKPPTEDNYQNTYRIGLPNTTTDKNCYKQTHTHIPHYKNCHFDINSILSKKWYQHITIFWAGSYGFAVVTYVVCVLRERPCGAMPHSCVVELSCRQSSNRLAGSFCYVEAALLNVPGSCVRWHTKILNIFQ